MEVYEKPTTILTSLLGFDTFRELLPHIVYCHVTDFQKGWSHRNVTRFRGCIAATRAGDGELHGVGSRSGVGMGGLAQRTRAAIAKVPSPRRDSASGGVSEGDR